MTAKPYVTITALLLIFFGPVLVSGQSNEFIDLISDETIILNESGIIRSAPEVKKFITTMAETNGSSYEKKFETEVSSNLTYEIGEIRSQSTAFCVMSVIKKNDAASKIELLVVYKKENHKNESAGIDTSRNKWMELCNSHQAARLVEQLYTVDALYYNQGRLLRGTEALINEYSYMNNPAYTLKLTPKHVVFVTEKIAFEIGQCSGSYPLPYMLLWEKQSDGHWQVRMDSNN